MTVQLLCSRAALLELSDAVDHVVANMTGTGTILARCIDTLDQKNVTFFKVLIGMGVCIPSDTYS